MNTKSFLFAFFILCSICLHLNAQTEIKKFIGTNGPVNAIMQNGDTTYIGGSFSRIGMNVKGLARFKPGSNAPDIDFPELGGTSTISAIASDGQGGSYLAGHFNTFDNK